MGNDSESCSARIGRQSREALGLTDKVEDNRAKPSAEDIALQEKLRKLSEYAKTDVTYFCGLIKRVHKKAKCSRLRFDTRYSSCRFS